MALAITIDLNVDEAISEQIKHNGLTVVKNGKYLRVRVGTRLLAREDAIVVLKDLTNDRNADPKNP